MRQAWLANQLKSHDSLGNVFSPNSRFIVLSGTLTDVRGLCKLTVPGVANPFVQTYSYDELNRITNAEETSNSTQTWEQTFTYDRYGNRDFVEANTTTLPKNCGTAPNYTVCSADVPVVNPSVNTSNNKLNGTTYDAAGNVIVDAEGRQFTYDAENKQIEAKNASNASLGTYYFDGDGKRVKKFVPGTGETTIFVYDAGGKLIQEHSTIVASSQDAKTQYLTNDHLGTPRINTNSVGVVVSRSDYMPYGEEITSLGGRSSSDKYIADDVRQGFTGYVNDSESGLDFAQARMYAKNTGRFSGADPLFIEMTRTIAPQAWNLYSYARNNPLKFVDLHGLEVSLACSISDTAKKTACEQQTVTDLNNRKGAQFKTELKEGKLSIVGKVDTSKLTKGELALYNAIADTKNMASIEVKNGSQAIMFGYSRLNDALKPSAGKNDLDRVDLNQLNKADSSGTLSGEVVAHEIVEAYVSVAEGLSDYTKAHSRANEFFGNVKITGLTTLPAGSETAFSSKATYTFGRVGMSVSVEKLFTTPQPAQSVQSNYERITGNLQVTAINPAQPPVLVKPSEKKP